MDYIQKSLLSIWENSTAGQWLSSEGFTCYPAPKIQKRVYIEGPEKIKENGARYIVKADEFGVLVSGKLGLRTKKFEEILEELRLQFLTNYISKILRIRTGEEKEETRDLIKRIPIGTSKKEVLEILSKKIKGYSIFIPEPEWILKIPVVKKCLEVFGAEFIESIIDYDDEGVIHFRLLSSRTLIDLTSHVNKEEVKRLISQKLIYVLMSFYEVTSGLGFRRYDITPMLPLKVQKFLESIKEERLLGKRENVIKVEMPRLKEVNVNTVKAVRKVLLFYSLYLSVLPPKI